MTMVEKIARAIAKAASGSEGNWIDYQDEALAALKVLREPSEGMKTCSEDVHWGYSCHICGGLKEGWQAMIDAAIQEHEGP